VAPAPSALTAEGTPHLAARGADACPSCSPSGVYGWQALAGVLSTRRVAALAPGRVVCVEAGGYFYDMYVPYPGRR